MCKVFHVFTHKVFIYTMALFRQRPCNMHTFTSEVLEYSGQFQMFHCWPFWFHYCFCLCLSETMTALRTTGQQASIREINSELFCEEQRHVQAFIWSGWSKWIKSIRRSVVTFTGAHTDISQCLIFTYASILRTFTQILAIKHDIINRFWYIITYSFKFSKAAQTKVGFIILHVTCVQEKRFFLLAIYFLHYIFMRKLCIQILYIS